MNKIPPSSIVLRLWENSHTTKNMSFCRVGEPSLFGRFKSVRTALTKDAMRQSFIFTGCRSDSLLHWIVENVKRAAGWRGALGDHMPARGPYSSSPVPLRRAVNHCQSQGCCSLGTSIDAEKEKKKLYIISKRLFLSSVRSMDWYGKQVIKRHKFYEPFSWRN